MTAEPPLNLPEGPLNGVTVIDLTRVLAGPFCTMQLYDLGARVIKVENPNGGDDARHIGPFMDDRSAYFTSLNRGKESIALDLKADADRDVFEKLLGQADVIIENYRPGVMDKLGYGWRDLHARFPRLIYAAASGFGQTGPYRARAAYDMVVQGMGGIMSVTGHPGGPPTRVGSSIGDISAALFTAIGICSALYHRERTGEGLMIDVAMLDCQIAILENAIARYYASGAAPGPLGARHPSIAPFAAFATADSHIIIAAGNEGLFASLCAVLGRLDLADNPLFASNDLRCRHVAALTDELEAALAAKSAETWLELLDEAGVPSGPINNVAQALADPQVAARNMAVPLDDPGMAALRVAGNPIKLSAFADPASRPAAPTLDGDREALLAELEKT
ncbi:MAG: CaiB/BaiF CoA transferase family protein [Sphingomonadales bacterium]